MEKLLLGALATGAMLAVVGYLLARRALDDEADSPEKHRRVTPIDLRLPRIPPGFPPCSIESYTTEGIVYEVDLSRMSCTCKDFQARKKHSRGPLSACCKHLLGQLSLAKGIDRIGKWEKAIIDDGHGDPLCAWLIELDSASDVLATASGSLEWINVFAHSKRKGEKIIEASGTIRSHGWNVEERRWSYGEGPAGSRELTPLMREVFG